MCAAVACILSSFLQRKKNPFLNFSSSLFRVSLPPPRLFSRLSCSDPGRKTARYGCSNSTRFWLAQEPGATLATSSASSRRSHVSDASTVYDEEKLRRRLFGNFSTKLFFFLLAAGGSYRSPPKGAQMLAYSSNSLSKNFWRHHYLFSSGPLEDSLSPASFEIILDQPTGRKIETYHRYRFLQRCSSGEEWWAHI